jgi:hypothetical protein
VTIEQLGSLGELIAAIATVVTLVYLATQLRQNTSTARSNSAAADTQNQNALAQILVQDREVSRVFWLGLESRSELDSADQHCFDGFMGMMLMYYEQSWRFHEERAISEASWQARLAAIRWLVNQPGFGECWAIWSQITPQDFAEVIKEARRGENPISIPPALSQRRATADSA